MDAAANPRPKSQKVYNLELPPTKMPRPDHFEPIACPYCSTVIEVHMLDIVIDHYCVPPSEEAVLRAVWKGKGRPVQTSRIFDAMYADDPDGGPPANQMYRDFKALMHNLRCRLAGSGITIENVGYRQGYRLVIGRS